jgi:hypothetical protein
VNDNGASTPQLKKKYRVWMVDDLESKRGEFKKNHQDHYDVDVFSTISQVMTALKSRPRPDALVCDIYFYPQKGDPDYDPKYDQKVVEGEVTDWEKVLHDFAQSIDAESHQLGITLAHYVNEFYRKKPPFPVFAYSAKAAYLMDSSSISQVEEERMVWLSKKVDPGVQRMVIDREIQKRKRTLKDWTRLTIEVVLSTAGLITIASFFLELLGLHL